ncbi:MAG: response regulator transcription factor [Lentimicrobium sp.]|jgi:two-component system alkaline phosphatase synthesis response regulator PhoP|nr:response regulator transcription factor [Lentimicrobium sp.]
MDNSQYKILLVDDEVDVLEFLSYNLKKEGYNVFTAKNGRRGLEIAEEVLPHLIILDVMMPEMDGIDACRTIRSIPSLKASLIVFLTARGEDYSQIAGFKAGADDYITKPIKPNVLTSRIKALLRRYKADEVLERVYHLPDMTIDQERYVVVVDSKEIKLPRKEFEILLLLTSKPNKVFSRYDIFMGVWGNDVIVGDRTIDVHVRKIREKIGTDNIKTIKGVGYKYEPML